MAGAAHEVAWQFNYNYAYATPASVDDQTKWQIWALKQHLIGEIALHAADGSSIATGAIQGKWTVYGSSDGSTAGMDGQDRWGTTFDLSKMPNHASGQPMAWTVLQSPLINGQRYWLMLSFQNATTGYAFCDLSAGGGAPSGGSATTLPAVSGSLQPGGSAWGSLYVTEAVPTPRKLHFALAPDGTFFAFATRDGLGFPQMFAAVLPILNSGGRLSAWSYPVVAHFAGWNGTSSPFVANVSDGIFYSANSGNSAKWAVKHPVSGSAVYAGPIMPAMIYNGGWYPPTQNWTSINADAFAGDYPIFPLQMHAWGAASGVGATLGRVPDLGVTYVTPNGAIDDGTNPRFITLGNLVIPTYNTLPSL